MKKLSETFEKKQSHLADSLLLGLAYIGMTKVHCILQWLQFARSNNNIRILIFQDSHSFGIFLCEVCQPYRIQNAYSFGIFLCAVSFNSTVFRIPFLLVTEIFLCEAYRFQKTSQTSDAQKNTPLCKMHTTQQNSQITEKLLKS